MEIETRRPIPASHGEPLDGRLVAAFALAGAVALGFIALIGADIGVAAASATQVADYPNP